MSKKEWLANAKPVVVTVEGQSLIGNPRTFQSGSVGYNISGKIVIGGQRVMFNGNLTVIGSKDWALD